MASRLAVIPKVFTLHTWLMEEKHMKESPLVVARALVRLCDNTVVVQLLNPDTKPSTICEKSDIYCSDGAPG